MSDEDGYFDERIASTYDESIADEFAAAAVDPVVDFIAASAGRGGSSSSASARAGSRSRSHSAECPSTGSICHGRWWHGCVRSRAAMRSA